MSSKIKPLLALAALLSAAILVAALHAAASDERPIIVCTTEVLGSVARALVGNQCTVVVLANPSLCPSYYDIKPGDVYAVSKASLLFYHGIPGEWWLSKLIEASETKAVQVKVSGPWNTPPRAKSYVMNVSKSIKEVIGIDVSDRARKLLEELDAVDSELRERARALGAGEVKVVCMVHQRPFLEYLGFRVVEAYGPPEKVSAAEAARIVARAKEEGVWLVVDNQQSGVGLGAAMASEVGAVHVVLTNFPNVVPGVDSLAKMMKYNFEKLEGAVAEYRVLRELRQEVAMLRDRVVTLLAAAVVLSIVAIVEGALILTRRRPSR